MELTIGKRILEERKRLGWEQADLAQRLSNPVGQQTVSRWEKGGSRPRREVVAELAAIFGVDRSELLKAAGYTDLADQPQSVQQPVRPRLTLLPVWELNPDKFEEFVADIAQELRPDTFVSRFGGQGHTQYGVDVVAEKDSRYVHTYQVKKRQDFGPKDVRDAVAHVTMKADAHFLVLSRRSASPDARKAIQTFPGWTLWDAEDLSRIVRGFPLERSIRIVDTYFPGWREPFLGVAEPGPWLQTDEFFQTFSTGPIYNHDWTLVGRASELADVAAFVDDPSQRVALVVGRGGIGKSKLLREVARNVSSTTLVRFLKPGVDLKPEHFELLPVERPVLIVIDDAHDQSELAAVMGEILRRSSLTKILLSLRPRGLDLLNSEFRALGIRMSELPQVSLSDLASSAAEELAVEALGPGWPRRLAQRLGYLTADCLFITVVAGVLIRRGLLNPACVDHEETIRKEVLQTFRDVVIADPVSGDTEIRHAILDGIALLQPFRGADPAFQESLSRLIERPYDRAVRHIRSFEDAGVLMRRGSSLRIVPDLLGDVILSSACFDDASSTSTGYLDRGWRAAEGEAVQHLFVNASRVDWQVRHDHPGVDRLTDSLWETVDDAAHSAGILGRINLMKLLQKVAYFEPHRSLALVRWIMDNPTDIVEDLGPSMPKLYEYSYQDVLNEVPAVVRAVAYSAQYLRESAVLLWSLAATDRRETNRYPDHPLRILRGFAEFDAGKPLSYNNAMIDIAEEWLATALPPGAPSPFDVLEPLLATEGSEDSSDGFAIRFRPYLLNPSVVQPLRDRVLDLAFKELGSSDIRRAARAVKVIEASLHFPVGMFGRQISSEERGSWLPDFLGTLSKLKASVEKIEMDPVIAVAMRRALMWHLDYSQVGTRDAAHAVIEALPVTLETRTAVALFDGWGELLSGRTTNVEEIEELKQEQMEGLARETIEQYSDLEILTVLEARLAAQELAFAGSAGTPGPYVAALVKSRPSLGIAICVRAANEPRSKVATVVSVAISCLTEEMPDEVMVEIHALMATGDLGIRRSVANALGWFRGRRSTLLEGELDVLLELIGEEDLFIRRLTVRAAQRLADHYPAEALALLSRVRFADSPDLAEDVFQSFTSVGPLRWSQLPKRDADEMLQQLCECPSIDEYWIQEFLSELSKSHPARLIKLLMDRITHWEEVESALEYRPLPFEWHHPLQLSSHPDLIPILRQLLDWLAEAPNSWMRQNAGGPLFAAIAGNFDDPDVRSVIDEVLVTPREETMAALASVVREMPRALFLSDTSFVGRVFASASNVGTDSVDRVGSAMYGAVVSGSYMGSLGQPFERDVEQREKARALADSLTPGSPEELFYRSLAKAADEHIEWRANRDEKLLDGREW